MKTSGVSCETKFGLLVFLGHPTYSADQAAIVIKGAIVRTVPLRKKSYQCIQIVAVPYAQCTPCKASVLVTCDIQCAAQVWSQHRTGARSLPATARTTRPTFRGTVTTRSPAAPTKPRLSTPRTTPARSKYHQLLKLPF